MVKFSNSLELRNTLNVVLKIKKEEFNKNGLYVNEDNIFNFLVNKKWKMANDLRFYEIVSDILKLDKDEFDEKK